LCNGDEAKLAVSWTLSYVRGIICYQYIWCEIKCRIINMDYMLMDYKILKQRKCRHMYKIPLGGGGDGT